MENENKNQIEVIIETPRNCRNKYAYDEDKKLFILKKLLPAGTVFPFDFGFIPNTKGEDGDPLDVLVIMDEATYPGVMVECRVIGALEALQTERDGKEQRNDRLIGISTVSEMYADLKELKDMSKNVISEIEHFFISYNEQAGNQFKPVKWANAGEAMQLIAKGKA